MQFAANLGFLWKELDIPKAIHRASKAGFHAVECHWPYDTPAKQVKAALDQTGLRLLCLNTRKGGPGESGLSAVPGREFEAQAAIDEAIDYAQHAGAESIHVMAGNTRDPEAEAVFLANLSYARHRAPQNLTILIEPLNPRDWPGYFLASADQAVRLLNLLGSENVKMMFDCYHVGRDGSDVLQTLRRVLPWVGHIQIASLPHRAKPDQGTLDYAKIFAFLDDRSWSTPLGAEYNPETSTEQSLGWMTRFGEDKEPFG